VVPNLVAEACGRLCISPVRDAFAKPANHRFAAYWTKEDDAFAQPWDYALAGSLWGNPPFSRMEEVVAKAALEGCHMLVIAPGWTGPKYPWWASLYLREGSDLMPAPKWRTWAFLLNSCSGSQAHQSLPPPPPVMEPHPQGNPGAGTRALNSWRLTAIRTTLPLGSRPGKV